MRTSITFSLVCVAGLMAAPAAFAQAKVTLVPSLSVSSIYDDNLFARQQGDAGQIMLLRPSFDGLYESQRLKVQGYGSFDMQRSNHAALNTFDARRSAFVDTHFRATMDTTLSIAGSYDQTETPGELNFDSGILGDRQRARRFQVTPGLTRRLGERATVSGSFDVISETLHGADEIDLQVARANYGRRLSTRDQISAGFVSRRFVDPIGAESSNTLLAGWTREIAYATSFTVQGGPRVSSYRPLSPEVLVSFQRRSRRMRLLADYWHGETIVLGIHGPVRLDSVGSRIAWPLTRTLEFGLHAGISDIETLDARGARSYRSTVVGSWNPGGIYIVTGSYGLDFQQGDVRRNLFLDDEVLRHVFRVGLTIAPRISRSLQPQGEGSTARPRR